MASGIYRFCPLPRCRDSTISRGGRFIWDSWIVADYFIFLILFIRHLVNARKDWKHSGVDPIYSYRPLNWVKFGNAYFGGSIVWNLRASKTEETGRIAVGYNELIVTFPTDENKKLCIWGCKANQARTVTQQKIEHKELIVYRKSKSGWEIRPRWTASPPN